MNAVFSDFDLTRKQWVQDSMMSQVTRHSTFKVLGLVDLGHLRILGSMDIRFNEMSLEGLMLLGKHCLCKTCFDVSFCCLVILKY